MHKDSSFENVHVLGRGTKRDGFLDLIWTASGLEFDMNASELGLAFKGGSSGTMPWISVCMDGKWLARIPVQEGTNKLTLFKGMDPDVKHRVRIIKDFQAEVDTHENSLKITEIFYEGRICKPEDKKYKIEFVGDSITSGEGILGAHEELDWIPAYFSSVRNYAVMTADALNADFRLISQSGWGIVSGYDNDPHKVVPAIYDSLNARMNIEDYDNASWKTDAVVINLGTNDGGAFDSLPYTDPADGKVYKNKKLADGSYDPKSLARIEKGIKDFLKHLRERNPEAHLLWVFGMLGWGLADTIEKAVSSYIDETGDKNAAFLKLEEAKGEAFGSRGHPGYENHKAASEAIAGYLKNILK